MNAIDQLIDSLTRPDPVMVKYFSRSSKTGRWRAFWRGVSAFAQVMADPPVKLTRRHWYSPVGMGDGVCRCGRPQTDLTVHHHAGGLC